MLRISMLKSLHIFGVYIIAFTSSEEIFCQFKVRTAGYTCEIQNVFQRKLEATVVNDTHLLLNEDKDVEIIAMRDVSESAYVPLLLCNLFPNAVEFDIRGKRIEEISIEIFKQCNNVSKLSVRYMKLNPLSPDVFYHLGNVEFIEILYTGITVLPENLFKRTVKLTNLDLSFNRITFIFAKFPPSLGVLNLKYNICVTKLYQNIDDADMDEIYRRCSGRAFDVVDRAKDEILNVTGEMLQISDEKVNDVFKNLTNEMQILKNFLSEMTTKLNVGSGSNESEQREFLIENGNDKEMSFMYVTLFQIFVFFCVIALALYVRFKFKKINMINNEARMSLSTF
jgi:hypothetical protein